MFAGNSVGLLPHLRSAISPARPRWQLGVLRIHMSCRLQAAPASLKGPVPTPANRVPDRFAGLCNSRVSAEVSNLLAQFLPGNPSKDWAGRTEQTRPR